MARNAPILICLAFSSAVHIAVIVPGLGLLIGSSSHGTHVRTEPELSLLLVPEEPLQLQLGLDSKSVAKKTWVGYDQYEEQRAEFAEFDQAAFTDQPVAAIPAPAYSDQSKFVQEQKMSEIAQQTPDAVDPAPSAEPVVQADLQPLIRALTDAFTAAARNRQAARESFQEQSPQSQPSAPEQIAAEPQSRNGREFEQGSPEIGAHSDKQSPPTSVIDVPPDQWKLGKPLAAEGLELKPRKADFTLLTLLTANPANPLCEIVFNKAGLPVRASVIRTSGDKRVDDAILASLYRWRAAGKRLGALPDDETINIQMQLILQRRR